MAMSSATKPLSYQGSLIDGIAVRFEAGRIVEAKAARGEDVLKKVLDSDDGARRLGEVALGAAFLADLEKRPPVLQHPVRRERRLPHRARTMLREVFHRRRQAPSDEIAARGGNKSMIHIDWMIGSDRIDIDGVDADGRRTPVFRRGEWA